MYLFSRLATLRGNERRSLAWAVEMSNYVNAHSDHTVTLWRADFGYPVGTVAWSTWVESLAALNEGFARLADDDGYHDLVDAGLGAHPRAPARPAAPGRVRRAGLGATAAGRGDLGDDRGRGQRQVRRGDRVGHRDGRAGAADHQPGDDVPGRRLRHLRTGDLAERRARPGHG